MNINDSRLVSYLKKSFLTGIFKTIVVTLSTIIFLPLIISEIGMATYGLISLTMIFGGMVVFADFGISKAVTLLIGQDTQKINVNTIVSNALVINLVILFLIGIVMYLLILTNVSLLGSLTDIDISLQHYIIIVGYFSLCIMLLNNLLTAILESYYLMHYVNIGFMLSSILINIFIYTISVVSNSIYMLLLAPTIAFLLVTFYFLYIINLHTNVRLVNNISIKQIKSMISVSYKFLNIGLINSLVIPINKYMIIYITGNSSNLAIFDIGLKIALIANSLLNSLAQPLFGVFSNMYQAKQKIFTIALKISSILFGLYILGNIIFYYFGLDIVNFIDASYSYLLFKVSFILLISVSFISVSEPFYRALLGSGRLKAAFILKLIIPILNILLYFSLSNILNIERFAFAFAIATFVSSLTIIIFYIYTHKKELIK